MRSGMDYWAHAASTRPTLERLAALQPTTLACMHGSAWAGDGGELVRELAARVEVGAGRREVVGRWSALTSTSRVGNKRAALLQPHVNGRHSDDLGRLERARLRPVPSRSPQCQIL
jgi:hypothetical protein